MYFLILAIICSAAISVVMRFSEGKISSKMGMFLANYLICTIGALSFGGIKALSLACFSQAKTWDVAFMLAIGIVSGALYLCGFLLLQFNIRKNGMVLSSMFMKLGVVIPVIVALVIFREQPKLLQVVGIILTVFAIIFMNDFSGVTDSDSSDQTRKKGTIFKGYRIFLIVMLLCSGFTDSMANFYDKLGDDKLQNGYLSITFFVALCITILFTLAKKEKIPKNDLFFGALIGIPNYFCSRFLLASLGSVPATIVYPVYSVGSILLITVFGVILFKERLKKREGIAMAVILVALVLLNI